MASAAVSASSAASSASPLVCSVCNKAEGKIQRCARCHITRYCSRECQTKDWPKHRKTCQLSGTQGDLPATKLDALW